MCFAEDKYNYNFKKHKIICPQIDKDNLVVLSRREKTRLENYCLKENTPRSIGIVICLNTGIRVGEICALKWKDIDLEKNELHIRHTFATECIEVGMDVKSLSEILGHASVEITLNKYVHSSYKTKKKYLEKL